MSEPLLHLRRSENGHFVLVEPASQTVVVAEELGEAYARMCETLKAAPPPAPSATGARGLFERRGRVRAAVVVAALLVPLAWAARVALEVREAQVSCPPRPTRSQGHATRLAQTPSAFADREGSEDDDAADDDAAKSAKPAESGAPQVGAEPPPAVAEPKPAKPAELAAPPEPARVPKVPESKAPAEPPKPARSSSPVQ